MENYRDRLIKSSPVWSDLMKRSKPLVQNKLVSGGAAGAIAVSGILKGDELVSVINLTDSSDVTDEFKANDDSDNLVAVGGYIDNTGGTATTGDSLLVSWLAWA